MSEGDSDEFNSDDPYNSSKYDEYLSKSRDGPSPSALNPQEEKRRLHNALERKRRGNIKENFEMLFDVVPCDEQEKQSRAQILHSTVRHILKMNALIAEEEKYKEKCESDIEVLKEEIARLEKLRSDGVRNPQLSQSIMKLIHEARLSVIPDYNNIEFNEKMVDDMWNEDSDVSLGSQSQSNTASSNRNSEARKKLRSRLRESETSLPITTPSRNPSTSFFQNNGSVKMVRNPSTDYDNHVIPSQNFNTLTHTNQFTDHPNSTSTFIASASPLPSSNFTNLCNLDNNFELSNFTNLVSSATMVSIPSMISMQPTHVSPMPSLSPAASSSKNNQPSSAQPNSSHNPANIQPPDHLNYISQ